VCFRKGTGKKRILKYKTKAASAQSRAQTPGHAAAAQLFDATLQQLHLSQELRFLPPRLLQLLCNLRQLRLSFLQNRFKFANVLFLLSKAAFAAPALFTACRASCCGCRCSFCCRNSVLKRADFLLHCVCGGERRGQTCGRRVTKLQLPPQAHARCTFIAHAPTLLLQLQLLSRTRQLHIGGGDAFLKVVPPSS
jgi:hypothetical protein